MDVVHVVLAIVFLEKAFVGYKIEAAAGIFPKFTLYEIHKMVQDKEGLEVLKKIINLPTVKINKYYIQGRGYFDEQGYKEFIKTTEAYEFNVEDKSMFFRACPFVKAGEGCTLPAKYRSYICNFFICQEVTTKLNKYEGFKDYINERDNYVRWINWENTSLEALFYEKRINLIDNFQEIIDILKDIPFEQYEFKELDPIKAV